MRTSKQYLTKISDYYYLFNGEEYFATGKLSTEGAREFATANDASTIWINNKGARVLDLSERS